MVVIVCAALRLPSGFGAEADAILSKMPLPVLAAAAGAQLFGYWDTLNRRRLHDLAPINMHSVWLRLLIGPAIGAMAGTALVKPIDLVAAFGLSVIPFQALFAFAANQARTRFAISSDSEPTEAPTLGQLQGGHVADPDAACRSGNHERRAPWPSPTQST